MNKLGSFCLAVVCTAICSQTCRANAIISLGSQVSGIFDYDLVVTTQAIAIQNNQEITLTGLSGVTGAGVSSNLVSSCSGLTVSMFTSTSVTVNNGGGQCFFLGTYGTLEVDSSVTTAGAVNYSIQTPGGFNIGTVQGPVSTPEPGTGGLLLVSAVILCVLSRTKLEYRRRWRCSKSGGRKGTRKRSHLHAIPGEGLPECMLVS